MDTDPRILHAQETSSHRLSIGHDDSRKSSLQVLDASPVAEQEAKLRALIDQAVQARLSSIERSVQQQMNKLTESVKLAVANSTADMKNIAHATADVKPAGAFPTAPVKAADALGKGASTIADTVKRAMQRLEEKREREGGIAAQPSQANLKSPKHSTVPRTASFNPSSSQVLAPVPSMVKASQASSPLTAVKASNPDSSSALLVPEPSLGAEKSIKIDGKDYGEVSLMAVGRPEQSVVDDDDSNGGELSSSTKRPKEGDVNGTGAEENKDADPSSSGPAAAEVDNAEAEPTSPDSVASAPETPWFARGLSETHPLITIADVTFVTQGVLSCMLCVMQVYTKSIDFREGGRYHVPMVSYNAFAELFTLLWVATRFLLSKRRGDWEIIDDLPGIRAEYLKTWLPYDLLYAIPLDFIFSVWNWEIYRWIQLRHFLRLPRMFALGNSHNPLLSSRLWFRFLSFVFWMLLTMHFLACIFWALEDVSYDQSIYWAVATMTSVGYGDIVPTTSDSRIYVCFAMLFGIGMLSTMTAFATTFLTQQDKLTEEREAKKQMMYSMLKYYDIPWEVQREVIAAVPAMLENDNEQKFKEMNSQLPPFVAKKIDGYIRAKMLCVVPLFKRIEDRAVLLELSAKLRQQFYPAGEPIIEQGATDRDMYFLVKGVVEVVVLKPSEEFPGEFDALVVAVLQMGAFFGEVNLLRGGKRGATVRPMTLCEVLALAQPDFEHFMNAHPAVRTLFADQLSARVEQVTKQNEENRVDEALAIITRQKSMNALKDDQSATGRGDDYQNNDDFDDDEEPVQLEAPRISPRHKRDVPSPSDDALQRRGHSFGDESASRTVLRDVMDDSDARRRSSAYTGSRVNRRRGSADVARLNPFLPPDQVPGTGSVSPESRSLSRPAVPSPHASQNPLQAE